MSKYWRIGDPFMKKIESLTMPKKTEREDTLGFFNIHFVAKLEKKLKGGPFGEIFFSRSRTMPKKNWKGDPLVSPGNVCYAEENLFGLVHWANRWNLKFCRTFGRTILVTSGGLKKTVTKSHDYSRLFSGKAPTENSYLGIQESLRCN